MRLPWMMRTRPCSLQPQSESARWPAACPCRIKAPSVLSPVSFTAPLNHRGPILTLLTAHKQLSRQLRRNRLQCCTAYLLGIGVLGSEMLGGTEKSFQNPTLQCCLKFCLSSSPGLLCLNTASCRAITAHHIRKCARCEPQSSNLIAMPVIPDLMHLY